MHCSLSKIKLGLILLVALFANSLCISQTFDNYYMHNDITVSCDRVINTSDSGCVYLNHYHDSTLQYYGLRKIDKNGNSQLLKTYTYSNSVTYFGGIGENFIEGTNSSYFLVDYLTQQNSNCLMFSKINKTTLDTIKVNYFCDYGDNLTYMHSFVKVNDNKYLFIGNNYNKKTKKDPLFSIQLDSNLKIIDTNTIYTPVFSSAKGDIKNPITNKVIVISHLELQIPFKFNLFEMDTMGNGLRMVIAQQNRWMWITRTFYSQVDSSYVMIGTYNSSKTNFNTGVNLYRFFIAKYKSSNLFPVWMKMYGDESQMNDLLDATILNDGSIVACGSCSQFSYTATAAAEPCGAILKVDKDGSVKWYRQYNHLTISTPTIQQTEYFTSIVSTPEKGFIVSGKSNTKEWIVKTDSMGCTAPGCTSNTITSDPVYTYNYSISVTPPPPTSTLNTSSISIEENTEKFALYPNPSKGIIISSIMGKKEVFNYLGQLILITHSSEIDLSNQPNGIYFINFLIEKEKVTKKIIVSH